MDMYDWDHASGNQMDCDLIIAGEEERLLDDSMFTEDGGECVASAGDHTNEPVLDNVPTEGPDVSPSTKISMSTHSSWTRKQETFAQGDVARATTESR